ncbi:hypothetical protein AWC00_28040 [Mycobacterium conspicuum]|nr:hypothetical protein AWC00_28040 [Mycobacterium conspicuum]
MLVSQYGPNEATTRDHDRAAVLVGYTLLGAAMNGFLPGALVISGHMSALRSKSTEPVADLTAPRRARSAHQTLPAVPG